MLVQNCFTSTGRKPERRVVLKQEAKPRLLRLLETLNLVESAILQIPLDSCKGVTTQFPPYAAFLYSSEDSGENSLNEFNFRKCKTSQVFLHLT